MAKFRQSINGKTGIFLVGILAFTVVALKASTVESAGQSGVLSRLSNSYTIDKTYDLEQVNASHLDTDSYNLYATLDDAALVPAGYSLEDAVNNVPTQRPTDNIKTYVVQAGDTVSTIAEQFDIDTATILNANNLRSADAIGIGDKLTILPTKGILYKVKSGDTLSAIAGNYGITVQEIGDYNDLGDTGDLHIDEELILPGAVAPVRRSAVVRSRVPFKQVQNTSGYYGVPVHGVKTQGPHGINGRAIDVAAPTGTPIYAAAGGVVTEAKPSGWNRGYGLWVEIAHPNGTRTRYAHAQTIFVTKGQTVSKGQRIASVGSTGRSTGPHLHYEALGFTNNLR